MRSIAFDVLCTAALDGKVETKVFTTQSMSLIKGVLFKVLDVRALALDFIVCRCQQISLPAAVYVIQQRENKQAEQPHPRSLAHGEEAAAPLQMTALTLMMPANTNE